MTLMDGWETLWDNEMYAYKGDVMNGMMSIVVFPQYPFVVMNPALVLTEQRITELFTAEEDTKLLALVMPNPEHTKMVMTRRLMYLPVKYVTLFLQLQAYLVQEAWLQLIPSLEQDQNLVNCCNLVDWMRVALTTTLTQDDQGQNIIGLPIKALPDGLLTLAGDEDLLQHREMLLA